MSRAPDDACDVDRCWCRSRYPWPPGPPNQRRRDPRRGQAPARWTPDLPALRFPPRPPEPAREPPHRRRRHPHGASHLTRDDPKMADMTRKRAGEPPSEPLWDRRRVAAAVGISVRTLEYLDSAGKGPPRIRIGGAVRYVPAEVRAWIEASRELPTPTSG